MTMHLVNDEALAPDGQDASGVRVTPAGVGLVAYHLVRHCVQHENVSAVRTLCVGHVEDAQVFDEHTLAS